VHPKILDNENVATKEDSLEGQPKTKKEVAQKKINDRNQKSIFRYLKNQSYF